MGNIRYEFLLNMKAYEKIKKGQYVPKTIADELEKVTFSNETQTVVMELPIERSAYGDKWGNPSLMGNNLSIESPKSSNSAASSFNGFILSWNLEYLYEVRRFINGINLWLKCRYRRCIKEMIEENLKKLFPEFERPSGFRAFINYIKNKNILKEMHKNMSREGYISGEVYKMQKKSKQPKVPNLRGLPKFIEQLSSQYGDDRHVFRLKGHITVKL